MTSLFRTRSAARVALLPILLLWAFQTGAPQPDEGLVLHLGEPAIVAEGEEVPPLAVFGADADVDGTVRGMLLVLGGDADVTGTVVGDVALADGTLRLGPAARITGDVTLTGGDMVMSPGAVVTGSVDRATMADLAEAGRAAALFAWFSATLALLALAFAIVAVVGARPGAVAAASAMPVRAALVGLVIVVGLPLAAGLAFASGIGFGLGALLLAVLPGLVVAGLVVSSLAVGVALLVRIRPGWMAQPWGPYAAAAIGVLAIQLLWSLPLLWLGAGYAALHGIGALAASALHHHDATPAPAAPAELSLG